MRRMRRMVNVNEAALILNKGEEQVLRYGRGVRPKLHAVKDARGRVSYLRSEVEGIAWRQKGEGFYSIPVFKEICTNVHDASGNIFPIEKLFVKDAGTILALMPEGVPYGLTLLFYILDSGKDIILRGLSTKRDRCDPKLISGTRVLIVADLSRSGESLINAKESVMRYVSTNDIKVKGISTFVYDDFAKVADFWVERRSYQEDYLPSILQGFPCNI